ALRIRAGHLQWSYRCGEVNDVSITASELRDFYRFVAEKLSNGGADLSPEEALDEWRRQHPSADSAADLAAIQEALADMADGNTGVPFDQFDRDFRAKHH